jgi:hypothetical protein
MSPLVNPSGKVSQMRVLPARETGRGRSHRLGHLSARIGLPPFGPGDDDIHSPAAALAARPIRDGHFGTIALGHLGRVRLTPVAAPDQKRTLAAAALPRVIGGPV